jgi:hypothetical protein
MRLQTQPERPHAQDQAAERDGDSLYTLRYTHGSHLLAAGVPLTDVSKPPVTGGYRD